MNITDEHARLEALDPTQSFIVQAPAGSGKTELLTLRYLALLNQACEAPEEIIAITFTRKAAAQMRERILSKLEGAEANSFARSILENPQRLKILTIDALCGQLNNRLPLLSGYGASPRLIENALPYYQRATREIILQNPPLELLAHLDNQAEKLMDLCVQLLKCREQWLPYLAAGNSSPQLRQHLDKALAQLAQEILAEADARLNSITKSILLPLLNFAGQNLRDSQPNHPLTGWAELSRFPLPLPEQIENWRGLAQCLLTAQGEWRKVIDKRNGFPAKTAEKSAFENILDGFAGDHQTSARLYQILACPPLHYNDAQWHIIQRLIELLPLLAAQLQVIFRQEGVIDFVEQGLSASRALGDEQQPTDLTLSLDNQIRHLLVDEFQDTSVAQIQLLEKLLNGWEPGDGRTLFLVGDPMQSIYRFRNAEVGLFLRSMRQGIRQVSLIPLTLTRNFRSGETLIAWFNQIFPQILPSVSDLTHGAIPYSPTAATQPQIFSPAVSCHVCADVADEARQIVARVQAYQRQNPQAKIAILVRSRPHLLKIIPTLQSAQLKFQAMDIEPLAKRGEIQDLAALTRALHHRNDRIAWLAVLRAPYCGLTLTDLHAVAQAAAERTLYEVLLDFTQLTLSEDGRRRLQRIVPVLSHALFNRGRLSLSAWIEGTWQALGGPAGLNDANELLNTQAFFKLLMTLEKEQKIPDAQILNQSMRDLYAAPDAEAGAGLQIMTIHKAKGLEFDHVILPELQRRPAADDSKLLLWLERPRMQGGSHLILAPIKEAASEQDPMYDFLKQVEQQKLLYESERLLYVAATRACQTLDLMAVLPMIPPLSEYQPVAGSFLRMLWPYFRDQIPETVTPTIEVPEPIPVAFNYQRLTADWRSPPLPKGQNLPMETAILCTAPPSSDTLLEKTHEARLGTVIHEALCDLAQQGADFPEILHDARWERRLRQLGVVGVDLTESLRQVKKALQNTLNDPRGLWILSASHRERKNEYALSAVLEHRLQHIVIDRTFVDENDVRWIIDYKTGIFNDHYQEGYAQLQRYAQIMALTEQRPLRLGIYFPLESIWREWNWR